MKRKIYKSPALTVVAAEICGMVALSMDPKKVEWKDDVELETKEQSDFDNIWDSEW